MDNGEWIMDNGEWIVGNGEGRGVDNCRKMVRDSDPD
jgi:hypothetical protein